jgi:hypothetical protein
MLTFKRIVAAWILWCGADLVAMGVLTTTGVISVEGRPSHLPEGAQAGIWLLVSLALAVGCVKLAWAKIK